MRPDSSKQPEPGRENETNIKIDPIRENVGNALRAEARLTALADSYLAFYSRLGYELVPAMGLKAKDDPSLIFNTCTICNFKTAIQTDQEVTAATVQNGLRTRSLQELCDDRSELRWTGPLTMAGSYRSVGKDDYEICAWTEYANQLRLLSEYGFAPDEIKIVLHPDHREIPGLDPMKFPGADESIAKPQVEYSTLPADKFVWNYGIPGVSGFGADWYLRNKVSGEWVCWGNIIQICKDGRPVGLDCGGGLETLAQAVHGLNHKIEASTLQAALPQSIPLNNFAIKLADAIGCVVTILSEFESRDTRLNEILSDYVRGINHLRLRLGLSLEQIESAARDYAEIQFPGKEEKIEAQTQALLEARSTKVSSFKETRPGQEFGAQLSTAVKHWILQGQSFPPEKMEEKILEIQRRSRPLSEFSLAELSSSLAPDWHQRYMDLLSGTPQVSAIRAFSVL